MENRALHDRRLAALREMRWVEEIPCPCGHSVALMEASRLLATIPAAPLAGGGSGGSEKGNDSGAGMDYGGGGGDDDDDEQREDAEDDTDRDEENDGAMVIIDDDDDEEEGKGEERDDRSGWSARSGARGGGGAPCLGANPSAAAIATAFHGVSRHLLHYTGEFEAQTVAHAYSPFTCCPPPDSSLPPVCLPDPFAGAPAEGVRGIGSSSGSSNAGDESDKATTYHQEDGGQERVALLAHGDGDVIPPDEHDLFAQSFCSQLVDIWCANE
jgi:hypothetical protein